MAYTKVCPVCGITYETTYREQFACSSACTFSRYVCRCLDCGEEFRSRRETTLYCPTCRPVHDMDSYRKRKKTNPAPKKEDPKKNLKCEVCDSIQTCQARIWEVTYLAPCMSNAPVMLHERLAAGLIWDERSNVRSNSGKVRKNRATFSVENVP